MKTKAKGLSVLLLTSIFTMGGSCSLADGEVTCDVVLVKLEESSKAVSNGDGISEKKLLELNSTIDQVRSACDITSYKVGMPLADAFRLNDDTDSMAAVYLGIVPSGSKESEALYFRATELFVTLRDRSNAEKYLSLLRGVSKDPDYLASAETGFECAFGRCGLALDGLLTLAKKFPEVAIYHLRLAYSYADRHEFKLASEQFDLALEGDAPAKLDTVMGLVAVSSYVNSGERDKAVRLYERFASANYDENDVDGRNFARMRSILDDKSGKLFLFSDWPMVPDPGK